MGLLRDIRNIGRLQVPRVQTRSMSHFNVVEHTVRTQHSRDRHAGAARGRENDLRLHVKQYIPKNNATPKAGDVTIIGAHANGFPKEMYEPLWDELVGRLEAQERKVRGIWIADIASQGKSGIINEDLLGPDTSWLDHGRDLLYLINQFQDDMPHPIIGIGNSVGATHLTHLSLLHPRLLHSLVLVDPIIQQDLSIHHTLAKLSTNRREIWPSRSAAASKLRESKHYQAWDPRVLDKWIEHGLRDLPTAQHPLSPSDSTAEPPVTLSTTVAQEVYFYLRAYYPDDRLLHDASTAQELYPDSANDLPLCRPEMQFIFQQLPHIKPRVMYIFGSKSEASLPELRKAKMASTGTGAGGSGGKAKGGVEEVVLDCGHLVGFERTGECAQACVEFLGRELDRWEAEERSREERWEGLGRREQVDVNDAWRRHVGAEEPKKSKI